MGRWHDRDNYFTFSQMTSPSLLNRKWRNSLKAYSLYVLSALHMSQVGEHWCFLCDSFGCPSLGKGFKELCILLLSGKNSKGMQMTIIMLPVLVIASLQ